MHQHIIPLTYSLIDLILLQIDPLCRLELLVQDVESGPHLWGVCAIPAEGLGGLVGQIQGLAEVFGLGDVAQGGEAPGG